MKNCPYCAEEIQESAIKCKHCGSMLNGTTAGAARVVDMGPLRVTVKRQRISLFSIPFRVFGAFFGVVGLLLSIIVMFTVLGIPIGLLMMLGSMTFLMVSMGVWQKVECPHCKYQTPASRSALNCKCKKCKSTIVLDWVA